VACFVWQWLWELTAGVQGCLSEMERAFRIHMNIVSAVGLGLCCLQVTSPIVQHSPLSVCCLVLYVCFLHFVDIIFATFCRDSVLFGGWLTGCVIRHTVMRCALFCCSSVNCASLTLSQFLDNLFHTVVSLSSHTHTLPRATSPLTAWSF